MSGSITLRELTPPAVIAAVTLPRGSGKAARRLRALFAFAIAVAFIQTASACNIPVFRFALERWQSDPCEFVVRTNDLSDADRIAFSKLQAYARANAWCRIKEVKTVTENESQNSGAKLPVGERSTKLQFEVRIGVGRGKSATLWNGPLRNFDPTKFMTSPARTELARRLINGHSAVWLVLPSSDKKATKKFADELQARLTSLESKIPLPEGIGLPGSELYSSIPLQMKYSVLIVDASDPREKPMLDLLENLKPNEKDEPQAVPVFGKGRALEVVPASRLTNQLTEDLCEFLSGACSCQVKELNPGFDLPLACDWTKEIFGEDPEELPPADGPGQRRGQKPELLTIPPGRKG